MLEDLPFAPARVEDADHAARRIRLREDAQALRLLHEEPPAIDGSAGHLLGVLPGPVDDQVELHVPLTQQEHHTVCVALGVAQTT